MTRAISSTSGNARDRFRFSIDRGGTFCDIFCEYTLRDGTVGHTVEKLLSVCPGTYADAPTEGIKRIIERVTGESAVACHSAGNGKSGDGTEDEKAFLASLPEEHQARKGKISTANIEWIRMGTTVATNALLERDGEPFVLVTNQGLEDLAVIGNQSRPDLFDLEIKRPSPLHRGTVPVSARVRVITDANLSKEEDFDFSNHDDNKNDNGKGGNDSHNGGKTPASKIVTGTTGEKVVIVKELDKDAVRESLKAVKDKFGDDVDTLAVSLLHAYTFPDHEREIAKIALEECGFSHVSTSSGTVALTRAVPRTLTTCVDAYLTPKIKAYIRGFKSGFDSAICTDACPVFFMQSDGGLTSAESFIGHRAILSGPAGGVVGYSATCYGRSFDGNDGDGKHADVDTTAVIGFDMGGTSTDVSRYAGSLEHVYDGRVAGVDVQSPQLDITTVAAGGGSLLEFHAGLFHVGPGSAGASPGPVCYRNPGGKLAVTDANLVLGRLAPSLFPSIFGPNRDEPLDESGVRKAFEAVAAEVNAFYAEKRRKERKMNKNDDVGDNDDDDDDDDDGDVKEMSVDEIAYGFITVANEAMCRPIREITQARGFDTSGHRLACFGGAGGQHACAVARALGMRQVAVPRFSGILSAVGLGMAEMVEEDQVALGSQVMPAAGSPIPSDIIARLDTVEGKAKSSLIEKCPGSSSMSIDCDRYLLMRYVGTDVPSIVKERRGDPNFSFREAFVTQHKREFGFILDGREIVADVARVRCRAKAASVSVPSVSTRDDTPVADFSQKVYFGGKGRVDTPVYQWESMGAGSSIDGPAIVVSGTSTVVVEPNCVARMDAEGTLVIDIGSADDGGGSDNNNDGNNANGDSAKKGGEAVDPVRLSVFSHRFMSIAEQMGRTLQRTSVSTNIKERLDFSCALFGPDGGLVSNAPSIPVHLGAMSEAVRHQIAMYDVPVPEEYSSSSKSPEANPGSASASKGYRACERLSSDVHLGKLLPGDVLVANHPAYGGSHLPDITVITPVFDADDKEVVFFVASRGHHADIGGTTPGSMPAFSQSIYEEGCCIRSMKLVRGGVFQEEDAIDALVNFPSRIPEGVLDPSRPPVRGTRNLEDNLSDLRAQVAANQRGIDLVRALIVEYGLEVVQAYMGHVQSAAEDAVRDMLRSISLRSGLPEVGTLRAEDQMDDGTAVCVAVTIDRRDGSAVFDFEGTGSEVLGNWNAPVAITHSSVIYCLRSLVDRDVPLNQGCLTPVNIRIPQGSLLSPSPNAAVVGGNVLTSMRVTDVILTALGACACSQGCLNNVTFGTDKVGYYETIAGGAGAGPTWHGQSAVHTHMSNTRITDAEILERRYPVVLHRFSIRTGSGGDGKFKGGDGAVRELEFTADNGVVFSVLSERRAIAPRGMAGGCDGARGRNWIIPANADGKVRSIGGKNSIRLKKGDRVRIETPGAGGYGSPSKNTH